MFDVRSLYESKLQSVNSRYTGFLTEAFGDATGFSDILGEVIGAQDAQEDITQQSVYTAGQEDTLAAGAYAQYLSAIQTGALKGVSTATDASEKAVAPEEYEPLIQEASAKYGVPADLIRGIIRVESNFKTNAVSSAGAQGLMQLMPKTAASLGVTDPYDPAQNIDAGTRYIKKQIDRFDGDVKCALAAYNCGYYRVSRHYGVTSSNSAEYENISDRVKNYVNKVLKYSGMA